MYQKLHTCQGFQNPRPINLNLLPSNVLERRNMCHAEIQSSYSYFVKRLTSLLYFINISTD